jgi:mannosylfructose-phosphate synthase
VSTLLQLVPYARLVAAVDGENREEIEALKQVAHEMDVAEKIEWPQYIPDEDLANYYRAVDVFALSSCSEPFDITAIEATACGTPTVVTVHGGLRDLIDFGT